MIGKNRRPINLNFRTIQFPITAIASILHRISGVLLFIVIGPILRLLHLSLSSNNAFTKINDFLVAYSYTFKFLIWSIISTLSYHIMFGISQILMDFGYMNQTLLIGRISVVIIFMLIILLSIYVGILLIWYA